MAPISIKLIKTARQVHRWLRISFYESMACQSNDWAQRELTPSKWFRKDRPIKLDIRVARKNRLDWAWRRTGQQGR